jgi:hypothetical protein
MRGLVPRAPRQATPLYRAVQISGTDSVFGFEKFFHNPEGLLERVQHDSDS